MMPSFKTGTLKLISKTCFPVSLKYVKSCASNTGWIASTALISNDFIIHYDIDAITAINPDAFVLERQSYLACKWYVA